MQVLFYGVATLGGNTLAWSGPTFIRDDGSKYWHIPSAAIMMFVSHE